MKIHPSDLTLEEFLLSLDREQDRLVRHVAGCSYCRAKLYYLPRPPVSAADGAPADYRGALENCRERIADLERLLAAERDAAPALFVELMQQPAEAREALLFQDARFRTWGVFELLVERSWEVSISDPAWAEELGRLALRLSDRLDSDLYRPELIEDLRARAWSYIGNARRSRSDLRGAEEAFKAALSHLAQGTKEPGDRGVLLDLRASLLRAQRDFDGALRLLQAAVEIFLEEGDEHRAGRSLVKMATVHEHANAPEHAIPVLQRALGLIDPEQEPRLLLCARHNLITVLADSGRHLEAHRLYRETRSLYRNFAEPWVQNRRRWVRAKIARGSGQTAYAEMLFLRARDGFVAEGIPYDTALVSLELAALYAEQGRAAELKALAEEMMPVFASRRIHREALAALLSFQQAVAAEKATLEVVQRVAEFLKRAEHDLELRFQEQAGTAPLRGFTS